MKKVFLVHQPKTYSQTSFKIIYIIFLLFIRNFTEYKHYVNFQGIHAKEVQHTVKVKPAKPLKISRCRFSYRH